MAIDRCRVVLIRPHYAGNLGSVARAMANFGLRDLVLVEPIANRQSMEAVMMATRGLDILTGARIVATIAEAVADCTLVIATSGETGGLMRKGFWGTPEEKVPAVLDALDQAPAALLFGPEPHGMTLDELGHAHGMIYIPADPRYDSLNLAQAVAVCLYELRRQWLNEFKERKALTVRAHSGLVFEFGQKAARSIQTGDCRGARIGLVRICWTMLAVSGVCIGYCAASA